MENKRHKALAIRKTVVAQAMAVTFGAAIVSTAMVGTVFAQSSAGSITVKAAKNASVLIEGKQIGVSRTVKVNDDGSIQVTQLPAGVYQVTVTGTDGKVESSTVNVQAGQGTTAAFGALMRVEIVGSANRTLDVKSTESSQTLTKAAIDRIPVVKDATALTLLSPGAVEGDGRMGQTSTRAGNIPSLGGASPAENTYYINGFNVTNIVNGLAFNEVPFEAIGEHQVKTGGYGAEFGRSLGGVVSINTKRGTDEWRGGVSASYTPKSLSGSSLYTEKNTATGAWDLKERPGGRNDTKLNAWIGGPLIKDQLYIFALAQGTNFASNSYGVSRQTEITNTAPQGLVKLDWNINKNNLLEFTAFSDRTVDNLTTWVSPTAYKEPQGANLGTDTFETGGTNQVLKWTSWINDDFNVSALWGRGVYSRASQISSGNCPVVQDQRGSTTIPFGCSTVTTVTDPKAGDKRDAFRLDLEYSFGKHRVRAGLDKEVYTVTDGTVYPGVSSYVISKVAAGGTLDNEYKNNTGADMDVVAVRTFFNGGTFEIKNSAWYVEDNYQVSKNLLVSAGLRNEQFSNFNANGIAFVDVKNTWAPRLAAAWDVNGNSNLKVYGNYGRYYIPVYGNTNVRLSGAETDFTNFYAYNGSLGAGPTQIPGLGTKLGNTLTQQNGLAKNPLSVVDPNIKPLNQDELIIGFQKALNNGWSYGVKYTHRKLNEGMDDICEAGNVVTWALTKGYTQTQADALGGAIDACFLANPGRDLTANVDFAGDGKLTAVTVPASVIGNPQPERIYDALEFTFERSWDKKWSFQGSYVYAKSQGNTEGYVKSDIGQDDAGISIDFDHPGLMEYSYGPLANNRTHSFKFFGSYALDNEWRFGGSLISRSGRPLNCLGFYNGTADGNNPDWNGSRAYGSLAFYCDGKPSPRGSRGELPWTHQINLQANYTPAWQKGLTLTVDALNVLNTRTVKSVLERGESALGTPRANYLTPQDIQSARSIRLSAMYEF